MDIEVEPQLFQALRSRNSTQKPGKWYELLITVGFVGKSVVDGQFLEARQLPETNSIVVSSQNLRRGDIRAVQVV